MDEDLVIEYTTETSLLDFCCEQENYNLNNHISHEEHPKHHVNLYDESSNWQSDKRPESQELGQQNFRKSIQQEEPANNKKNQIDDENKQSDEDDKQKTENVQMKKNRNFKQKTEPWIQRKSKIMKMITYSDRDVYKSYSHGSLKYSSKSRIVKKNDDDVTVQFENKLQIEEEINQQNNESHNITQITDGMRVMKL